MGVPNGTKRVRHDLPVPPPRRGKTLADDQRWEQERQDALHTRLARVQSAASTWLGVLGTLFGLSGAVVLIKGSTAFVTSAGNAWLHWGLIALVIVTFVVAILAVITGGAATWGGLGEIARLEPVEPSLLDKVVLAIGPAGLKEIITDLRDGKSRTYQEQYKHSASRRRGYLHISRGLGVVAAVLAGAVVAWTFVAGTTAQASPRVIVVHNGRVSCTTVGNAGKYTGVTQVIPVTQC